MTKVTRSALEKVHADNAKTKKLTANTLGELLWEAYRRVYGVGDEWSDEWKHIDPGARARYRRIAADFLESVWLICALTGEIPAVRKRKEASK